MILADRLKAIRQQKNLSQGDIEKRSGLLRCYISRCENGHTVPNIGTIEKLARALQVPMYQIFYDGEAPPVEPLNLKEASGFGSSGADARTLSRFRRLLARTNPADQKLLIFMAQKMARQKSQKRA